MAQLDILSYASTGHFHIFFEMIEKHCLSNVLAIDDSWCTIYLSNSLSLSYGIESIPACQHFNDDSSQIHHYFNCWWGLYFIADDDDASQSQSVYVNI